MPGRKKQAKVTFKQAEMACPHCGSGSSLMQPGDNLYVHSIDVENKVVQLVRFGSDDPSSLLKCESCGLMVALPTGYTLEVKA